MLARVLLLTLAALLALPIVEGAPPAEAGKKFKRITRTFSNSGPIAIGDAVAVPYPSTIQVSRFKKGKIKDVNLTLHDFSHTAPDDVDILLLAPNGRNLLVMSDVGGIDDANTLTLTLDDEAGSALPLNSQLSSGAFQPTNELAGDILPAPAPAPSGNTALSVFDGGNPNGQWSLFIHDDVDAVADGSLDGGWSLEIKAKVKKKKKR